MCRDPNVIDPPGFDVAAAWRGCHAYSDRMHAAERPIAAAAGADPGICSCPACGVMYWAWGRRQRCADCGFAYPVDWWAMYSYGVQAALRPAVRGQYPSLAGLHAERLAHPYYRFGFENPVEDAWANREKVDWRAVMAGKEGV